MADSNQTYFKLYAENTTIHGIKDFVFSRNRILKVAWGLLILVAAGGMCEEIYRSLETFREAPTAMEVKVLSMDQLPPIHVCSEYCYIHDRALEEWRGLEWGSGDVNDALAYLRLTFLCFAPEDLPNSTTIFPSLLSIVEASIKWNNESMIYEYQSFAPSRVLRLMADSEYREEQKRNVVSAIEAMNLTTGILLDSISWKVAFDEETIDEDAPDDFGVTKVWPKLSFDRKSKPEYPILCKSISSSNQSQYEFDVLGLDSGYVVVGEDPYGPYHYDFKKGERVRLAIAEASQTILLDKKGSYCNQTQQSALGCGQDIYSEIYRCYGNGSAFFLPYSYSISFSEIDVVKRVDQEIQNMREGEGDIECLEKALEHWSHCNKPCNMWNYEVIVTRTSNEEEDVVRIAFQSVTNLKVSKEFYTYPSTNLLGNVGGLVSLFCGASVLSFVQLVMFCCGEGFQGKRRVHDGDQMLEEKFHQFRNKYC